MSRVSATRSRKQKLILYSVFSPNLITTITTDKENFPPNTRRQEQTTAGFLIFRKNTKTQNFKLRTHTRSTYVRFLEHPSLILWQHVRKSIFWLWPFLLVPHLDQVINDQRNKWVYKRSIKVSLLFNSTNVTIRSSSLWVERTTARSRGQLVYQVESFTLLFVHDSGEGVSWKNRINYNPIQFLYLLGNMII